ncbi:protein kinase domain-containing protein [Nocardioides dongkuii]|uniref:protein kinase domain-containing protein n=1 Tax=Nocardioides dongkuii TaxID=2760089 RepID=UPI0015F8A8D4|nr:protein kinase [Nocardioides dongkuii]
MSEHPAFPDPGAVLGRYAVGRRLGDGPDSDVFEAMDEQEQRLVALTVFSEDLDGAREQRVRELVTAWTAINSSHLLPVHEVGEEEGRLWVSAQLAPEGGIDRLREQYGPPAPATAVALVADLAAGLADLHEAGLVHGSVDTEHVLLHQEGEVVRAWLAPPLVSPPDPGALPADDVRALGDLLATLVEGAHEPGARGAELDRVLASVGSYPSAAAFRDDLVRAGEAPRGQIVVEPSPSRPYAPMPGGPSRLSMVLLFLVVLVAAIAALIGIDAAL